MRGLTLLRVALVAFVIVWLFGPYALRSAVPAWLVFLIALGLELNFFLGALRPAPAPAPDRGPQPIDRERYGGVGWVVIDREAEAEPEPGLPVRQFLVGLGVIAALILLVWVVERGTGWDALDADTQAKASKQVLSLKIDPEAVSKDDVEMLQDLILAAINDGSRKADEAMSQQMSGMMGGMKIPGLF